MYSRPSIRRTALSTARSLTVYEATPLNCSLNAVRPRQTRLRETSVVGRTSRRTHLCPRRSTTANARRGSSSAPSSLGCSGGDCGDGPRRLATDNLSCWSRRQLLIRSGIVEGLRRPAAQRRVPTFSLHAMFLARTFGLTLGVLVAALVVPGGAVANGDPASDVLQPNDG
jgi:hypothetical protein